MQRTLMGRITVARGLRHQLETYARWASELGSWWWLAAPFLLWTFQRAYQAERRRMQEEHVRELRREREEFLRLERQLARQVAARRGRRGLRWLPRRMRRVL
ncbi:hypothetical protein [Kallotenue papyrolyticum]|uniref:hypothetical protein n=1 Tax=Kallotenue papyrolyticum TaxID=1325125 RepID=UPI0004929777|nr:hypothetical protein [Kallotenue papyrolyticum]